VTMRQTRACQALSGRLVDYIKGELSLSGCRSLESHLRDCAICAGFERDLRREIEACRAHGGPTMPATTRRRAQQRVKEIIAGALRRH